MEFVEAVDYIDQYIRSNAPVDTGNLKFHAIDKALFDGDRYIIEVRTFGTGKGDGTAPYMKYTNESWSQFESPLKGKQNPNEKWWDSAIDKVINDIAGVLKGSVTIQ